MRHARAYGIAATAALAAVAIAVATAALAQTSVTPLPETAPVQSAPLDATAMTALAKAHWGDAKAGAAKAATCAACHGVDGNPSDPQYPRLAGMPERYTAIQLALFKSGERHTGMSTVMMPMAMPLSAQDMRDVGAWFAQQKAGAGIADDSAIKEGPNQGMQFYQAGQNLFRHGDFRRGIPACMACHGPTGAGNPGPAYPRIGGQQSAYVVRRLQEFREGTTGEQDPKLFNVMATVARSLSDEDIQWLGNYVQGLHARSDEASPAQVAATRASIPTSAPAPTTAAPPESTPAPVPEQPPAPTRS